MGRYLAISWLLAILLINNPTQNSAGLASRSDAPVAPDHNAEPIPYSEFTPGEQEDLISPCSTLTIGQDDSCEEALLATIYQGEVTGSPYSPRKMHFARRLNEGVYYGGQLTARQIKYAADSGFRSILSVFEPEATFAEDGTQLTPSAAEERTIVENVAGMKYFQLLTKAEAGKWFTTTPVERMGRVYPQLEFPALFHCEKGVSIVLITLLHYANMTLHNPNFQPAIDIHRFYKITATLGLDFVELMNLTKPAVEEITQDTFPNDAKAPNVSFPGWMDYWQSFPVYHNWFIAGQITDRDSVKIKKVGFVSVVNTRKGLKHKGKDSQETVELLNIKSKTPTYGDETHPPRQSQRGLRESVLVRSRQNSYISPASRVNYESSNPGEFGDSIGYNEEVERKSVLASGLDYYNLPYDNSKDFEAFFSKYKDDLMEIGTKGPVLVHCARGYRAAVVAVLAAAVQYDLSLEWALQRMKEMGFGMSVATHPDILKVYKHWLRSTQRVEL